MSPKPFIKSSVAFDQAYARLNTQQKLAVDTIDGPVMVIAGPGTGKTQILATRIANILQKTDTNPYSILALTFTESAAKNMRERLVSLIGPTAYSVHVQTFHAFCDEVIRACPEFFPLDRDSQVLTDLERYDLMEQLLQNPQLQALRTINSPFHYLKAIIKAISDLKREGVNEHRFAELVVQEKMHFEEEQADLKKSELVKRQKNIAKMEELSLIFQQYQQKLREMLRYDYDDMIVYVAEAFAREEELLLQYQERLTYFLVDEYQDTNAAQNKVVDLLASFWGEQANIFVVGDPHQSIYRFQGASLENTLNFLQRYPTAQVVNLEVGYRCPQVIYDAAAEVIQHNSVEGHGSEKLLEELGRALQAVHKDGAESIVISPLPSTHLETIYIAEEVRKLLEGGVRPDEIAVLYKNNADSVDIQLALEKWGIPFATDSGDDALHNDVIIQFLTLLKVIADVRSAVEGHELFEVMNYPWLHLNPLHVMTLARAAGKTSMSIFDRLQLGYVEFCKLPFVEHVTAGDFAVLQDFVSKLSDWVQQDAEMTFPAWFEMVMKESGFLDWVLLQESKGMLLQHINAVFREVKALAMQDHRLNLTEFLQAVHTMREHGIQIIADEFQATENAVTLSTVHKAKGREWEYVFLANCVDGKWGNTRTPSNLPLPSGILVHSTVQEEGEKDRNEDDRRLFYVALTRAKKQITITYPQTLVTGNRAKPALGSMFIEEIGEEKKTVVKESAIVQQADEHLAKLLHILPPRVRTEDEKKWLRAVVSDFKLSITALNIYLRSPEQFVEDVLLKVPRAKEGYQAFGTAVHFALEHLYKHLQSKGEFPKESYVLGKFEESLRREVLTKEEFELRLNYGKKMLKKYMEEYMNAGNGDLPQPIFVEKFFGSDWNAVVLDTIPLSGRIDRIDWVDQSKKLVRVIDYKTGRARTSNEIEGKVGTEEFSERELDLPESIRGPYKRQLLFYKLLTQLDHKFDATVVEGMFDFVEPDRDGKFTRRSFSLLDEDVDALKDLIRTVTHEIRNLEFLED